MANEVIGIAGCGAMGEPIAQRLLAAGFEVWIHDVRPLSEFGAIATYMVEDAAEFARRCNIVISVVRDVSQTRSLLFGEAQGIVHGDNPPEVLVILQELRVGYHHGQCPGLRRRAMILSD